MTIHFWNTGRLAVDLAQRKVSSEEKFYYLVANNCVWAAAGYIGSQFFVAPAGWLFWYEGLLVIIITAFGLIRCRDKYRGAIDNRLLEDCIILGVPLSLKLLAFTWLAYFGFDSFFSWLYSNLTLTEDSPVELITFFLNGIHKFYPFLIVVIGTFIYYLRLSGHLKTVAVGVETSNSALKQDAP